MEKKMNLFLVILYAIWGVLSVLTIIAPFSCGLHGFWKGTFLIAGLFNLLADATNIPQIIKYFKKGGDSNVQLQA